MRATLSVVLACTTVLTFTATAAAKVPGRPKPTNQSCDGVDYDDRTP